MYGLPSRRRLKAGSDASAQPEKAMSISQNYITERHFIQAAEQKVRAATSVAAYRQAFLNLFISVIDVLAFFQSTHRRLQALIERTT